jgi:ribonuclease-3
MAAVVEELESRLGYRFRDRALLLRALTHKSWVGDQPPAAGGSFSDYEQLEFLGDAVLGFLASDYLIRRFPQYPEGKLTPLRAAMVNRARLYKVALEVGLGEFLRLGKGEERSGGRGKRALLANSMEALLGAIYLDAGMPDCREVAERLMFTDFPVDPTQEILVPQDAKGALQAYAQIRRLPIPKYVVVKEQGPVHARVFTVEARVGKDLAAQAEGTSKKTASLTAAELLLEQIRVSAAQATAESAGTGPAATGPEPDAAPATEPLRSE